MTAEEKTDYKAMTVSGLEEIMTSREKAFAEQYEITGDVAESAKRTCYKQNKSRSAYAAGARMMRNPKIKSYLHLRRQELFRRLDLSTETLATMAWEIYIRTMQGRKRVFLNRKTQQYEPDGAVLTDCRSAACALKLAADILRISEQPEEKKTLDEYFAGINTEGEDGEG